MIIMGHTFEVLPSKNMLQAKVNKNLADYSQIALIFVSIMKNGKKYGLYLHSKYLSGIQLEIWDPI